jgi:hypothetical protein
VVLRYWGACGAYGIAVFAVLRYYGACGACGVCGAALLTVLRCLRCSRRCDIYGFSNEIFIISGNCKLLKCQKKLFIEMSLTFLYLLTQFSRLTFMGLSYNIEINATCVNYII